mmetsp:Transcript_11241/g.16514  ORF Transcript_11241/g.16514 Transcript_11241/m.16514 type:complete len:682 (-) Transcript_11241:142-2187(-)|eukprot:CAMPEP_0194204924 /NCGR_PEP_ID=MMETSP0156-20130528/4322_1 /TAXON_ID=33649 /ORGANISM="Thalassionema nitzschioides, Strain L26-B" /LENGTH=681 /DNA_ID=CAMNT_0038931065 /DNA_START=43 /DNA_END=2088 /DNA_ORIENTATION=-
MTFEFERDERQLWSVEVPNTERDDRGAIRRCFDPMTNPQLGEDGVQTLYEGFRRGVAINPLGPCLGFRAVGTNGFPTPFVYSSYKECLARINAVAAGYDTLNLLEPNEDGLKILVIYLKNCMEWTIAEHAAFSVGGVTAPMYDTLGPDTVRFIFNQTGSTTVICSRSELNAICEAKKSGDCPKLKHAIIVDGVVPESVSISSEAGIEVLSLAQVEATGAQRIATQGHKHSPPSRKDVATFCYTSGTTGNPKGALMTHENFLSAIAGIGLFFRPGMSDRHLSYLPLPHIFERVVASHMLMTGASIAFFRGNPLWLVEDLQACRPTILPAAPRVLNKIYDKIMAGITAAGGTKKKLFDAALKAKTEGLKNGHLTHAVYDYLIFNKVKKALGLDCVRFMVSGSAPLSGHVMAFFRCLLGVPIVEGYGQTEGTAAATIAHPDDISTVGHVGGPIGSVEIVLMDVPEMGYLHNDKDHRGEPCQGRGEICVRGPSVFKGYYKDEEKTRETIDEEGWLHSGDIGLWTMQGALKIIDRKKNIFKLSIGEYVAPEKIENIISQSALIGQSFVYGDSFQNCLVAIIVPDEEPSIHWAKSQGGSLDKLSFTELCKTTALKESIMSDIKSLSSKRGLHGFETVKDIFVDSELFTVENGLVTPTFKIKRQQLRDRYQNEINNMYEKMPSPKSKL